MGGPRRAEVRASRPRWAAPARSGTVVRVLLVLLISIGLPVAVPAPATWAQPAEYSGAEIRARVVDAETQQPLEGVFVVARWLLDQSLSREQKPLHVMETVTDAKGEFYFPRWGPKPRPAFTRLWGGDPRLTFFKPGYEPMTQGNATAPDDSPVRVSQLHGETIPARRFRGTPEIWVRLLAGLQITLDWGATSHDFPYRVNDHWKHYPRTVLALVEERERMPKAIRHHVSDLESWDVTEDQLRASAQRKGALP